MKAFSLLSLFLLLLAGDAQVGGVDIRWPGMVFAVVLMLHMAAKRPARPKPRQDFYAWFTVFLIWLATSSLWAPSGARIEERLLDIISLAIILTSCRVCLNRAEQRDLRILWWGIFAVCGVLALVAMTAATVSVQGRVSALGGGPNVFVRIMAMGLLSTIAIGRAGIFLATAPAFLMLGILSGSRGGLVALAVTSLALILIWYRFGRLNLRAKPLMLLVLSAGIFRLFFWERVQSYVQARFLTETFQDGYTSGRDLIVADTISLFRSDPVFGAGLDGYWALTGRSTGYHHPHNMLAAAAGEAGFVGFILLAGAVITGFKFACRTHQVRTLVPALTALMFAVASLFSGYWYDTRFIWFFLLLGSEATAIEYWAQKGQTRLAPARLPEALGHFDLTGDKRAVL